MADNISDHSYMTNNRSYNSFMVDRQVDLITDYGRQDRRSVFFSVTDRSEDTWLQIHYI